MNTEDTVSTVLAFPEGIILMAETQDDPEAILRLGPPIKILRMEP